MNQEEFVECLRSMGKQAVRLSLDELRQGPMVPKPESVGRSKWFRSLSASDQRMVESVIEDAIDLMTWRILVELDGVGERVAGNREEGMFELRYVEGGASTLLNSPLDPDLEELHEIYNSQKP